MGAALQATFIAAVFVSGVLACGLVVFLVDSLKRRNAQRDEHECGGTECEQVDDQFGLFPYEDVEEQQQFRRGGKHGCYCPESGKAFEGEVHRDVEHGQDLRVRDYAVCCHDHELTGGGAV